MKWRQFFTPVKSFGSTEAQAYLKTSSEEVEIIDVRQPSEYEQGHIAGAKLIPLASLSQDYNHLDPEKPTLVYCAIGGRSRVAAQQLAGQGFKKVINLNGGYKAWQGLSAFGTETQGMDIFSGAVSGEQLLVAAYSLEEGLEDFYLKMTARATRGEVQDLFEKLAEIEDLHKDRLFDEYTKLTGAGDRKAFEEQVTRGALEGGMTTEEYLALFSPDLDRPAEVISLAMSIEAQALDLYTRASRSATESSHKEMLERIAAEEKSHLEQLGKLMDVVVGGDNG